MIDLSMTPRCAKYLKAMRVNLDENGMNEYWAAVCIAESFSDKKLKKFGGINFHVMTGPSLLLRMEEFLVSQSRATQSDGRKTKDDPVVRNIRITAAVSNEEIEAGKSPKGGWKATQLAKWGVPWPPPNGWRKQLIANYENQKLKGN